VLLLTGDAGFTATEEAIASMLAAAGALVFGVDLREYRAQLAKAWMSESYPSADLELLSQFAQRASGLPTYEPPVIVGVGAGAALAYAALAVSRIAPSYVTPQYSIRQASREIGRSLATVSGSIATSKAEGLFNDNRLPYRSVLNAAWPTDGSEALVVGFGFAADETHPPDGYRRVGTYRLAVSPEYAPGPPEPIRVYRRGDPAAPPRS